MCSYKEIDSNLQTNQEYISKNFSGKISLIQEITEHSIYLSHVVNTFLLEDANKAGKKLDGPPALILILYGKNNTYLIAASKLVMLGLINPSNSIMRAVFEGITQMYLLHLTTEAAELFYKKQMGMLTSTEERKYKKEYHYLSPGRVRNILYVDKKSEMLKEFYSVISNTSHPSIRSAMSDIGLRDDIVEDTLNGIIALGSANIIAFNEIYSDKYDGKTIEAINALLEKVSKELGSFIIDIVPNHPSFSGKLKFAFNAT